MLLHKEDIAKVCYEANRAYCEALGDYSFGQWDAAPQWQKDTNIKGVEFHLSNPNASASASHDSWLKDKTDNGWKYGPIKDAEKKEHPCIVPFSQLPFSQQLKDVLFKSIVSALSFN